MESLEKSRRPDGWFGSGRVAKAWGWRRAFESASPLNSPVQNRPRDAR